ncbi:MAG TPA: LysR family transcriptional regulator [Stellaceae bacterium]|nr:LysR family transcriptional regulator [Stellaceae bacterium]
MELFQVRYFLALAKTLNFTRAAEACNVSQPALTRAIQRLEEELGGALLYRERNLTQLTELGKVMLPHLETAFLAAEAATAEAAAFKRRDVATLRVGLGVTISADVLTPVLRELETRISKFELALAEGAAAQLFDEILDGGLDTGVVVEPEKLPERLNRWPLFEDRYVVLCPAGHRFESLAAVPTGALAEECVVLPVRRGCDFAEAFERLCLSAGIKPRTRQAGSSEDHVASMVRAGLGVTISAAHRPAVAGLVARPLADPDARRRITVVAAAGRQHGHGLALFLKLMRARDWSALASPASSPPSTA